MFLYLRENYKQEHPLNKVMLMFNINPILMGLVLWGACPHHFCFESVVLKV